MLPVAGAGLHVVAPDCRRYGRTSRADVRYDDDPRLFATLNGPERLMASAFGYRSVAAVHRSRRWFAAGGLVMMSHPFAGPRALCQSSVTRRWTVETLNLEGLVRGGSADGSTC
jgi:hypothetical protein